MNKERSKTQTAQVNAGGSNNITKESSSTTQTTTQTSVADTEQREAQHVSEGAIKKTLQEDVSVRSSGASGENQQSLQSSTSSQRETNSVSNATQTSDGANKMDDKVMERGSHNKSISTQTSGTCDTMSEDKQLEGRGRRATLPIARRGQFFNDSYFEDTWKNYQDAVRDVLSKWNEDSAAATDDMTCYRRLRSRDMREENQAITSTEDSSSYKVNDQ